MNAGDAQNQAIVESQKREKELFRQQKIGVGQGSVRPVFSLHLLRVSSCVRTRNKGSLKSSQCKMNAENIMERTVWETSTFCCPLGAPAETGQTVSSGIGSVPPENVSTGPAHEEWLDSLRPWADGTYSVALKVKFTLLYIQFP